MALPRPNDDMPTITTPVGTAVYPHLHAPDTRFDDPPGKYKTDVLYTGENAEKMKKILTEQMARSKAFFVGEEGKADSPKRPWKIPTDEDGNEQEGILVSYTMKAGGQKKDGTTWSQSPAIFDAQGQPIEAGLKIGGGSKIKVAFQPYLYHGFGNYGVAKWLRAVQVIDLETWEDRNTAESFGFGEEEGFTADEASPNYFAGDDNAADEDLDGDEVDTEIGQEADF